MRPSVGCSINAQTTTSLRRNRGGFGLLFVEMLFMFPCRHNADQPRRGRSSPDENRDVLELHLIIFHVCACFAYISEQECLITLQITQIQKL